MRIRYGLGIFAAAMLLAGAAVAASTSPVADAAMNGDRATVQSLLKQKADVNAPQADGATAIQWAAYNNDVSMADLLIGAGANVNLANHDGATPLYLASMAGNAAMIGKLLAAGAYANEVEPDGITPLMLASRNGDVPAMKVLLDHGANVAAKDALRGTTPLMWAAEQGHPEAVQLLIAHGADVGAITSPDTKGNRAYLAPSKEQREEQDKFFKLLAQGTGGKPAAPSAKGAKGADVNELDAAAAALAFGRTNDKDGGGLTALVFAARQNCIECAKELVAAGANVNQTTRYGWTPLLTATQNRHYLLGKYLLDQGANPNIANKGGWTPLYIAVDNRNIEGGDYPVRNPDMDHLDFIKLLLSKGANVNARVCGSKSTPTECKGDSTETRTIFTMQWLYEDGATPFLRAAQSGDVTLMKLLLAHGADPKIATTNGDTALSVASGIGWVEGVTYQWSDKESEEAVKLCLDLGIDPNAVDKDGRTALHGAAHKGDNAVVQLLVDHGAKLDARDFGSRDTIAGPMAGHTWIPLDYAQGLVRVGVQSAIPHPETAGLIRKLMAERGLPIPKPLNGSICLSQLCK